MQLEGYFHTEAAKDPQPEIHLRPDRRALYDVVAKVLAAAQRNRMKRDRLRQYRRIQGMSRNEPGSARPVAKQLAAALLGAALLLAGNFLAIAASAAADKPGEKPKISAAAGKTLKAAQDALEKQDYPTALTHLKEAEALPNKTEFDEYTMNQMYLFYYSRTNDMADAEKVLESLVGSPYLDKADLPARLRTLAQINYQAKDYDKAIQYGERAIKEGNANDDVYTLVDQAYYLKGDYAGALKSINAHMDVASKGGQPPSESLLKLGLSTCLKLNDNDCTTHALDRRVAALSDSR